jgi:hypothetical protein
MKKIFVAGLILLLAAMIAIPVLAVNPETGNGAPSGPHFNLNIIGALKDKNMPENLGGNAIFVQLGNDEASVRTRINLVEGDDFAVIDATNGPIPR